MLYVSTFVFTLPAMHKTLVSSEKRVIHSLTSTCKEMHRLVRPHFPYSIHTVIEEDTKSEVVLFPEFYREYNIRSRLFEITRKTGNVTIFNNLCQYEYPSHMLTYYVEDLLLDSISREHDLLLSAIDNRFSKSYGQEDWKRLCDIVTTKRGSYKRIVALTEDNKINYSQYVAVLYPKMTKKYMRKFCDKGFPEERNPDFGKNVTKSALVEYFAYTREYGGNIYRKNFPYIVMSGKIEIVRYMCRIVGVNCPLATDIPSLDIFELLLEKDIDIRESLLVTKNIDVLHRAHYYVLVGVIPGLDQKWTERKKEREDKVKNMDDEETLRFSNNWKRDYKKNIRDIVTLNYDIDNILEQCELYEINLDSLTLSKIYELKSPQLMKYHIDRTTKNRLRREIKELKKHRDIIDKPWNMPLKPDMRFQSNSSHYDDKSMRESRKLYNIMIDELGVYSTNILDYDLSNWTRWMQYTRKSTFEMIQYTLKYYFDHADKFLVFTLLIWLVENPIHCKKSEREILRDILSQVTEGNFDIVEMIKDMDFTLH